MSRADGYSQQINSLKDHFSSQMVENINEKFVFIAKSCFWFMKKTLQIIAFFSSGLRDIDRLASFLCKPTLRL